MATDLLSRVSDLFGTLRHLPDQRKHDARREQAKLRAQALGRPRAIVFICVGNICRSPYAAERLRLRLAATPLADVSVRSAGLVSPGRPSPKLALESAAARGVKLDTHVSRPVEPTVMADADVVVVMGSEQAQALRGRIRLAAARVFVLGDFDPLPIRRREIEDPVQGDRDAFDSSYERIDRCVERFADALLAAEAAERR